MRKFVEIALSAAMGSVIAALAGCTTQGAYSDTYAIESDQWVHTKREWTMSESDARAYRARVGDEPDVIDWHDTTRRDGVVIRAPDPRAGPREEVYLR